VTNEHAPGHQVTNRHPWLGQRLRVVRAAGPAAVVGVVMLACGCGGSSGPGVAGGGLSGTGRGAISHRSVSSSSSGEVMPEALAYARCMRAHGVPDFPDPIATAGGGVAFQVTGGPGSELSRNNPRFKSAEQVCRSQFPGEDEAPAPSSQRVAAEVRWAHCLRSHGLPGFPDPNPEGAFDSSRFNDASPAFQAASKACKAVEPAGPISAVPGHGPDDG
jgi:hypothetical protein